MTCPSSLTCSQYADAALSPEEAAVMEGHLASCGACRDLVAGFSAENRAMRVALQSAELTGEIPAFAPPPTIWRLLAWLGLVVLAAWVVNAAWTSLTSAVAVPNWFGWLAPDVADMGVELAIGLMVSLAAGSGELLDGVLQAGRFVVLFIVGSAGIWLLIRRGVDRTTSLCVHFSLISLLLTLAPQGHAIEVRRDEDRVTIPAGETIDDTLLVAAENILIEGNVTGDLIVLGEQVSVRGRVGGVLVAIAEDLNLEGEVAGSVLSIGETVDFRGMSLAGNAFAIGRSVTMHADTLVEGNVVLGAADAVLHGKVGRDLVTLAQRFSLSGVVEGELRSYGEQVDVEDSASVGGDLTATVKSADHLKIAPGASVEGETDLRIWPKRPSKYVTFEYYLGEILKLLAAFVTGLVLFQLFPTLVGSRLGGGVEALTVAGIGAVALIATPVLALAATLTLIGAPLGILAFLLWLASLYVAGVVTAGLVGRLLLDEEARGRALPLLLGLVILFVLINLPLIGDAIRLIAMIVGLGLIVRWLRQSAGWKVSG